MDNNDSLLNFLVFAVFVAATLILVFRVGRRSASREEFFTASSGFSGRRNGFALAGDFLSAASFLGITGAVALNGYDSYLYSIGFVVGWLVALLLVAQRLRNTGKVTMGDAIALRLNERPIRIAAGVSTLAVTFFYLLAQMAGAGGLVALLLDVPSRAGQSAVIVAVGGVMIVYVLVGGMRGTTAVQILKAVLLLATCFVLFVWALSKFSFNPSDLIDAAVANSGPGGSQLLDPGKVYGLTGTTKLDFVSLALALVLGTAGLPHILMRFYTVPDAREARKSASWAIGLITLFNVFVLVLGFGAAAIVGPQTILGSVSGPNSAGPLLAEALGGTWLLAIVCAVAFATILAVVAGLVITAAASFAHDIYARVIKRDQQVDDAEVVRVARRAIVLIGIVGVAGGIVANGQNVAFLVALAFAVAASANLPTLVLTMYWKRFTTAGALASMYGGLLSSILLIVFSPAVSGKPVNPVTGKSASMIQGADFHWFPLDNPGIVSIPLSFALAIVVSLLTKDKASHDKFAGVQVLGLVGADNLKVAGAAHHGLGESPVSEPGRPG